MTGTDKSRSQIELCARSLFPIGAYQQQEQVIERLDQLDKSGRIADFSVIWGKCVATNTTTARPEKERYILNRVAEFKQWALSKNIALELFHQTQTVDGEITEDSYTTMTLPVMGPAEYSNGELVHVAPSTKGDTVRQVEDRLTALESTPSSTAFPANERGLHETSSPLEGDADD